MFSILAQISRLSLRSSLVINYWCSSPVGLMMQPPNATSFWAEVAFDLIKEQKLNASRAAALTWLTLHILFLGIATQAIISDFRVFSSNIFGLFIAFFSLQVEYPYNLSYRNLYYFMFAPTLCYEPSYPKTKSINKVYLARRVLEIVSVFLFIICLLLI